MEFYIPLISHSSDPWGEIKEQRSGIPGRVVSELQQIKPMAGLREGDSVCVCVCVRVRAHALPDWLRWIFGPFRMIDKIVLMGIRTVRDTIKLSLLEPHNLAISYSIF